MEEDRQIVAKGKYQHWMVTVGFTPETIFIYIAYTPVKSLTSADQFVCVVSSIFIRPNNARLTTNTCTHTYVYTVIK